MDIKGKHSGFGTDFSGTFGIRKFDQKTTLAQEPIQIVIFKLEYDPVSNGQPPTKKLLTIKETVY